MKALVSEEELVNDIKLGAKLIATAKYVVALTGAGMSVESGIPPFRGPNGIWTRYGEPDMQGYQRFLEDPKAYWDEQLELKLPWRKELHEALRAAKPNPGHYALAELENMGIVKYLITQNIDNLHYTAGSRNTAEIHGNTFKVRCISCNSRFNREEFSFMKIPPTCPNCGGLVKIDTVMWGEPIPHDVLERCRSESYKADCMILGGTSAVVYPAAELPLIVKREGGSLIEVNPRETELTNICDIVLRAPAGKALPLLNSRIKELQN